MSDVDPSGILQGTVRGIMNAVACYTQENSTFARVQQDNLPTAASVIEKIYGGKTREDGVHSHFSYTHIFPTLSFFLHLGGDYSSQRLM